ncbi:MAG: transposase [Nitrospirales bacterium]|nr:transposase [Nitrospirales bacterium]
MAGEVVLQLKTLYQDGTTHLVMSPREFLQRLAARVPRPRLHLNRFHGGAVVNKCPTLSGWNKQGGVPCLRVRR